MSDIKELAAENNRIFDDNLYAEIMASIEAAPAAVQERLMKSYKAAIDARKLEYA